MKKLPVLLSTLFVLQLMVAVICAPYSCEWGNAVYFYTGTACLIITLVISLLQTQWELYKRLLYGLLLLLLSALLWFAGFMLLDFRIMCRLF